MKDGMAYPKAWGNKKIVHTGPVPSTKKPTDAKKSSDYYLRKKAGGK